MFSIVQALGWPIWPLLLASVVALALIIERAATLQPRRVLPARLLDDVIALHARGESSPEVVAKLERSAPLGRVLAAGLRNLGGGRESAAQAMLTAGGQVANELSRYLTLLGSIGSVAPLLGLFGTVIGMIEIFSSQQGGTNPQQLAHGISIALYSTAFGIIVAVPAIVAYRHFRSRVDDLVIDMERQAQRLLEVLYAGRPAPREAG